MLTTDNLYELDSKDEAIFRMHQLARNNRTHKKYMVVDCLYKKHGQVKSRFAVRRMEDNQSLGTMNILFTDGLFTSGLIIAWT